MSAKLTEDLINAPLVVANPDTENWDDTTDVLVIGFGGAGVCAALEAREQGADVLVIDRFDGGGATRYSGGLVYFGAGTPVQRECGVEDTVNDMANYLSLEVGDAASPEIIRKYCEESSANFDWLVKYGVPFSGPVYTGKAVLAPEGFYLQYSGNEKAPSSKKVAKPAARGHRAVGVGFTGYALFDPMHKSAQDAGVRIMQHSPVTRLIVNGAGRVIGVEVRSLDTAHQKAHQKAYLKCNPMTPFNGKTTIKAMKEAQSIEEKFGRPMRIKATRGVVLCTGGFSNNQLMLDKHAPSIANISPYSMRLATLGCDGSGHQLGASVGGELKGMDRAYVGRNMVPTTFTHGVLINNYGKRFAPEDGYNSLLGGAILAQPKAEAKLIINSKDFWKVVKQSLFGGWVMFRFYGAATILNLLFGGTKRAKTIHSLALKLNVAPNSLEKTVNDYNFNIDKEDEFGKVADNCKPLKDSSYYAINFSLSNVYAFSTIFTLGGLSVSEETGMVLKSDGTPIQGLYAAGRAAFGLCSNQYVSGLSLGDNVFSGRRAGAAASKA